MLRYVMYQGTAEELKLSFLFHCHFTHESLSVVHCRYHVLDIIDTSCFDTIRYCARNHLEETVRCVCVFVRSLALSMYMFF